MPSNAWKVIEDNEPGQEPAKKHRCPERLIRRCVLEAGHEGRHVEEKAIETGGSND